MKLTPDRGGPRINEGIDTPNIQLIDATGHNVGVVAIADALARAAEAGLDLVEISPNSEPPVCKILDFGKYKYQAQKKAAEAFIAKLSEAKVYNDPIVTQVVPLEKFYEAENYHQDFLRRNPKHPYIVYHDLPKLENLKKQFPTLYSKK